MQLDMFGMNYVMTTFNGSWANEMNRHDTKVAAGRFANYSYAGTSSNRANPFVMISREETTEDFGECIGTNLIIVETIMKRWMYVLLIKQDSFQELIHNQ